MRIFFACFKRLVDLSQEKRSYSVSEGPVLYPRWYLNHNPYGAEGSQGNRTRVVFLHGGGREDEGNIDLYPPAQKSIFKFP